MFLSVGSPPLPPHILLLWLLSLLPPPAMSLFAALGKEGIFMIEHVIIINH